VRQCVDERARLDELCGGGSDLVEWQEKQAVVLEERASGRLHGANELFGLFLQCWGQQTSCNVRKFRGSRFDYNKDRLRALWKGSAHCLVETRPLFIRLDETTDVSIDLEIVGDIKATQNGEHERKRDNSRRMTDRPSYKTNDR
jgi:hypothetical protein